MDGSSAPARLIHGTTSYVVAGALQRAAPILLLPVLAQFLTPEAYGEIGIIVTITALFGTIVGLGLETAVFRAHKLAADEADARRLINTVGGFALLVPMCVALLAAVTAAPFVGSLFDISGPAVSIGLVGSAATVSATVVPLALLRAQERLGTYVRLMWLQVVAAVSLMLVFVALLGWGVEGWFLANATAALLLLARSLVALRHQWSTDLDRAALRSALLFGIPLVPHMAAHWALAVSDRAILGAYLDARVVGGYYVAFLLTQPVMLGAIAISQATQPMFAEAATSARRRSALTSVATVQALGVIFISVAVALLGPPLVRVALPASYAGAAEFIPWLALGATFFGLYQIPMNAVSLIAGRTDRVWAITILAAAVNIGLNLMLVPRIGAIAAAVDTAIGYGVLLAGLVLYMRRVCDPPVRVDLPRLGLGLAGLGLAMIIGVLVTLPPAATLAVRMALLLASAAVLATVGPFRREAQSALRVLHLASGGSSR